MEFQTCPSCKASVLEDDAENCPFCGASMTGRPSAAAPSKPAAAESTTTAPAETAPPGKTAPPPPKPVSTEKRRPSTKAELQEEADPFEVDTRAVQKAIPVARKPSKGRMHRVVCPMCETPGFIAVGHSGKEVRCCNPKCLVPIFTAPPPEKPKEEEPEPKRGLSGVVFTAGAVILIGVVGFSLWHFVIRDQVGDGNGGVTVTPDPGPGQNTGENRENPQPAPIDVEPPPVPPVPLAEVRSTSLDEVVKAARQRQNNRSKPFGRRLSSESFAEVGQLDEAVAQIEAMRNVEGYEGFYEVEPWVLIALARFDAGDHDGAKDALDAALDKGDFPQSGRTPLDAAGALAGALAVVGRMDEAHNVAAENSAPELRGRLSTLWRGAIDSGSFEIDTTYLRPDLASMPSPQWVTVTRFLVFRGDFDAALRWAESAESVSVRDNALATWAAERLVNTPAPTDAATLAQIDELAERLEPAGRVRVLAAVAHVQRQEGASEAAAATLERAVTAASELTVPAETRRLPGLVEIYESDGQPRAGLPEQAAYVAGAMAFFDLAQLEATVGNQAQAWDFVQSALQYLRAATPGPVATQQLVDECEGTANRRAIERRLAGALEIDDAFLAFNQYRKQCAIMNDQATLRFRVQVELLRRAVQWGLGEQVWEEVRLRSSSGDENEREPWLQTSIPGMIVAYADGSPLTGEIAAALAPSRVQVAAQDRMELELSAAIEAKDFAGAIDALKSYWRRSSQDPYPLYVAALRGVSRLLAAGRHGEAFDLAMDLPFELAREDSYWLIAAAAMRDGRHSEIWRRQDRQRLSATERASLYRGFLNGLPLAPPEPESTEVAAAVD